MERPSADAQKRRSSLKKRAGYCGFCCDVMRDFTGHASRLPNCKAHKYSRKLNTEEWCRLEAEFLDEQSDPVAAKERRVAAAEARQASKAVGGVNAPARR